MTPERWQEIDKLLDSVLNLEESQRLAFVDQACRDDQELRQEVEALLRAYEQSVCFFELPAVHTTLKGISRNEKPSLEGRCLGSYRVVSLLGAGGMGEVYRAVDTRLSRTVAIKILPTRLSEESALRQQFEQEAQAISQLNHPHICTLYDVGKQEGIHFLVMEYLEGETLAQRLEKGPLALNEVICYALEVASALEEAHTRGIVHRDLKPGNIMLTKFGAKLLDFGLVKWLEKTEGGSLKSPSQDAATEGIVRGTVYYMSPEHVAGKSTDVRSDIFSFGSVLYEMATGQRAFQGNSMPAICNAILRDDPRPAGQIKVGIPGELERIMVRCFCKDPESRWQSMGAVKLALQELKEKEENKDAVTALGLKNRDRHSLIWAAGLILLIALVSLTAIFTQRKTRLPESVFTAVPLTSYPGMESQPSFSPDGSQVAFRWNGEKEDNFDIYVKSVVSG